jgi:hypothetical protein
MVSEQESATRALKDLEEELKRLEQDDKTKRNQADRSVRNAEAAIHKLDPHKSFLHDFEQSWGTPNGSSTRREQLGRMDEKTLLDERDQFHEHAGILLQVLADQRDKANSDVDKHPQSHKREVAVGVATTAWKAVASSTLSLTERFRDVKRARDALASKELGFNSLQNEEKLLHAEMEKARALIMNKESTVHLFRGTNRQDKTLAELKGAFPLLLPSFPSVAAYLTMSEARGIDLKQTGSVDKLINELEDDSGRLLKLKRDEEKMIQKQKEQKREKEQQGSLVTESQGRKKAKDDAWRKANKAKTGLQQSIGILVRQIQNENVSKDLIVVDIDECKYTIRSKKELLKEEVSTDLCVSAMNCE